MSLNLEQNCNIQWANPPAWVIISLKHASTQKPSSTAFLSYIFISFEQLKAIVYQSESIYPTFHSFLYLAHPPQQMIRPKATGSILRTDKTFISSENKRTKATRIGQCCLRFTSYMFGCELYHHRYLYFVLHWEMKHSYVPVCTRLCPLLTFLQNHISRPQYMLNLKTSPVLFALTNTVPVPNQNISTVLSDIK